MKVALVHSYYSSRVPSGENRVVDAQRRVLEAAGHEVLLVGQSTDARLERRTYPVEAAGTAATGVGPSPLRQLRRFRPDVVHVHNLFPNFGRTWLRSWPGPLVATLHNYRSICPATTLLRDGKPCVACPDAGSALPAIRHGCFHGSRSATLPVALGTRFSEDPLLARADVITTLSEGMRQLYARYGVPEQKLVVLDNFSDAPSAPGPGGDAWLFAGRIEPEKGLHDLVDRWPRGHRLLVAGAVGAVNPLPENPDVILLGRVDPPVLRRLMSEARGLVFPSLWQEGLALVCLEALSVGTPILTFDDIPAGRSVQELGIGVAAPRRDVTAALAHATELFPSLRARCREVYDERFTADAWLHGAEGVYERARAIRSGGSWRGDSLAAR